MKTLSTLLFIIFFIDAAQSQPGSLDSSFYHHGKRTVQTGGACKGVAIETRGRIVMAGDNGESFKVCRLKQNGRLDHSFGGTGSITLKINTSSSSLLAYAMAVQPDNKVIITSDDAEGEFSGGYVARVNANGTVDSAFGYGEGYTYAGSRPRAVAVQSDGKIVTAGYSSHYNSSETDEFEVIRFNTDGLKDNTFGTYGAVHIIFSKTLDKTEDQACSVAIQPDGKIVVAGVSSGESTQSVVARLLSNGKLDKTFGKGGRVVTDVITKNGSYGESKALTLQSDGKILVAGYYFDLDFHRRVAVVRYLTNGKVDHTYGSRGRVLLSFTGDSSYHQVTSMALQPNGKAILGGYVASDIFSNYSKFELTSLNTDGTLDAGFGSGGVVTTKFDYSSEAYGVAVQSDGKIVEAGSAGFAVARFIGEDTAAAITTINGTPVTDINTASAKPVINNIADSKNFRCISQSIS